MRSCSMLSGTHSVSPIPAAQVRSWPCLPGRAAYLATSLTLNWRRRLAISYSRCSSMPRWRHHLREFLLRSDFTWLEVQIPGVRARPAGGWRKGG